MNANNNGWSIKKSKLGFVIEYKAGDGMVVASYPYVPKWYWKWYYPVAIWKSIKSIKGIRLSVWGY